MFLFFSLLLFAFFLKTILADASVNHVILELQLNPSGNQFDYHICSGESIEIKCNFSDQLSPRYGWIRGFEIVDGSGSVSGIGINASLILSIDEMRLEETYSCGINVGGFAGFPIPQRERPRSQKTRVIVHNCSSEAVRMFRKSKSEGLILPCLQASDDDMIQWQLDGHILPNHTDYTVQLMNISLSDVGIYRCLARKHPHYYFDPDETSTVSEFTQSYAATYNVTVVPDSVPNFRVVNVTGSSVTFVWDSKFKLTNRVGVEHEVDFERPWGVMLARLTRANPGDPEAKKFIIMTDLENGILVENLRANSFYRADVVGRVHNRLTSASYHNGPIFFVTADISSDEFRADSETRMVNLGDAVQLHCGVDHSRTNNFRAVEWWRSPNIITQQEYLHRRGSGDSFQIPRILHYELGTYECFVYLQDEPESVFHHTIILSLNDSLSDSDRHPSPRNVQCTNVTHRSVIVQWLPPEQNSNSNTSKISGYKVRYWPRLVPYGSTSGQRLVNGNETMLTLENLGPETVYMIEVVAFEEKGESKAVRTNCLTDSEP